jgi:hypothetical protein
MAQNVYDQASRFAARLDPPGFLGWALGLPAGAFTFRGWLDTRAVPFPGSPDRTGDTVARLDDPAGGGVPWAVAVEFQVRPDPAMFGRLGGYALGLWLGLRPDEERGSRFQVGAAVVNLTGSGSASRRMEWPAAGLVTRLDVAERNLERESADELVGGVESGRWARCVLPWVPLTAGGDDPGLIDRWKRAAEAEPDPRRRAELGGLALVFADAAGRKEIWGTGLEGWNVTESSVVNEWIAQGEAKGEAKGEARGALAQARRLLLRIGQKRFGAPPPAAEAAVGAVADRDRLERMAERVLDAAGWDDLLATP